MSEKLTPPPESEPEQDALLDKLQNFQTFVEIGPGDSPVAGAGNLNFAGNRHYIGVEAASPNQTSQASRLRANHESFGADYEREKLDGFKEVARSLKEELRDSNLNFVQGDGTSLPLPDSSVDQVFMSDVANELFHLPGGQSSIKSETATDNLGRLILEVSRVLRPNGLVVIRNSIPGLSAPNLGKTIRESGLDEYRLIDEKSQLLNKLEKMYYNSSAHNPTYYLIARKNSLATP
ncbi:class I SAM-dependent methyltransferase [Candidatus Saccharibacteria bacterium]|nr:class I SAM-dependent methyltransferase [Candidatus Saccharibacteria bacterium]